MSRFIATVVVIAVVVGALLAAAGVLHFRNGTDETSITLDKKELKDNTRDVVGKTEEAGGKILDKTGQALHKAAEGLRGSPGDRQATKTPAPGDKSTR